MEIKNQKSKIKNQKYEVRLLYDMKNVLYDKDWLKTAKNFPVYYVYRGIKKKGGLRYDTTIISPKMLGKEFVKTKGNRNSRNFKELYVVLRGEAFLLMQKVKEKTVKDVFYVKLKKKDWVIIPPKYAAITINPSKQTLKIGTWVSEKNINMYKELEKMRGACYFFTQKGWIKNKNYKSISKLRFEKPLKSMPKDLNFLKGK